MDASEIFRQVNGWFLIAGSVLMLVQAYWQLKKKLQNLQRQTACCVVLVTSLVMLQYGLAATRITDALVTGPRGTVTILTWIGAVMWWTIVTYRDNRSYQKDVPSIGNPPIWKRDFWQGMFGDDR